MQVHLAEQGIVIEHLLEMGDQPVSICCVTVKAATYLVVNSPLGHLPQCRVYCFQGLLIPIVVEVSHQELQCHWVGKLGCCAKAAVFTIEVLDKGQVGLPEGIAKQRLFSGVYLSL